MQRGQRKRREKRGRVRSLSLNFPPPFSPLLSGLLPSPLGHASVQASGSRLQNRCDLSEHVFPAAHPPLSTLRGSLWCAYKTSNHSHAKTKHQHNMHGNTDPWCGLKKNKYILRLRAQRAPNAIQFVPMFLVHLWTQLKYIQRASTTDHTYIGYQHATAVHFNPRCVKMHKSQQHC